MTTCVRKAWLVLGAQTVQLENPAAGYFCSSLDLGYPAVRDVVSNRPDQDGIDDRTRYWGGRVISADITALAGAGATIDAVAASFAPFMTPTARPDLHYVLDRPGAAERVIRSLRASGYSWPVVGPFERDIQLQWIAGDPYARDPTQKTATAWAGSSTPPGRAYNLTFNRIYPPGASSPTVATITVAGDQNVRPLIRVYGPINGGTVRVSSTSGGTYPVAFLASNYIPAGQWVDIDCSRRTVVGSDGSSKLAAVDWGNLTSPWAGWPLLVPGANSMTLLGGTGTSGVTQAQCIWQDAYLS